MNPPIIADISRFCAPAPVNKVEVTGDVLAGGDTDEPVGVAITRTEVLLTSTLALVGEFTALDLAAADAVTLGPHG